jgi:L-lactate utilization protein LutC
LNACPIFREIGGYTYASIHGDYNPYPGPIGSALAPALFSQENFGHLAQASTLCGACKEACPVDIDLPTMLLRARAGGKELEVASQETRLPEGIPHPVSWGLRLFSWFAISPRRFRVAQKLAAAFSRIWSPRAEWMWLPAFSGWGFSKDFPRAAGKTFRERWVSSAPVSGVPRSSDSGTRGETQSSNIEEPYGQYSKEEMSANHLVTRFQKEWEALDGKFLRCPESELADQLLNFLAEQQIDAVMAWEDPYLPGGLVTTLQERGITIHNEPRPEIQVGPATQLRAGITGTAAAIAETGTLVITAGKGQPQSVSLLPEIHIAILREVDINENLATVLNLRKVREASSVTLISGPSRTADIEMTLTIGVHGPGEVLVFCI